MQTPSRTFIDSTDILYDTQALRQRAEAEGYLFFRKLLPAAEVLRVRRDLLSVVDRHGWRARGQDELGGTIDGEALDRVADADMREDIGVSQAAYHDVQRLPSVHRLPHHPNLVNLYRTLFGDEVLVHPRHIVRMITSHRVMHPTPPHQDFPLIQGTSKTWTCWFPIGDCPRSMGGLTVLRQSHRLGYVPITQAKGAGSIAAQLCPGENQWVEGDFEIGDVLTFPSFTVHKALPTQRRGEIRLSFDVRYQPLGEIVEPRSLQPHCPLQWEEIYAGWPDRALQYYWKQLPLKFSTFDEKLLQPGARRIC
jgi:ectoine hydroxylase-related dioxygenase (phytanoyl-CoA dioxygenase family)